MYAGHLWNNYNKDMFKRCHVAYNNIYRSLFNVKRGDSISAAFVRDNILGFRELLRKFVNSFHERILSSENNLVKTIVNSVYFMYKSNLFKTWKKDNYCF